MSAESSQGEPSASKDSYYADISPKIFSTSVNRLLAKLYDYQGGAHLLDVLKELYEIHPEYGKARGYDEPQTNMFSGLITFLENNLSRLSLNKPSNSWLIENVLSVNRLAKDPPVITGRMFLIAVLLLYYKSIYDQLNQSFEWHSHVIHLVDRLDKDLLYDKIVYQTLLEPQGVALWQQMFPGSHGEAADDGEEDVLETPNQSDRPHPHDALSRKALARYLSKRIRHIYNQDVQYNGPFFIQIDGAWGSGKSTLLGFLQDELEAEFKHDGQQRFADLRWIIADFNAWTNQRLNPPWWFLMKNVYNTSLKVLKNTDRKKFRRLYINEYLFRINTGNNYLLAVLITFILFIAALFAGITDQEAWKKLSVVQAISFLGFLWSLTKFLRSSLVPGSAKAAQSFIEDNGKDPLNILAEHFKKQIKNIGYPVAIFIDDLDRCNKDYGISLLEGLQTIFKEAPVVYVVAADRRWLTTMYEDQYKIFATAIGNTSKSFGLVFLDKTFQLIIELPDISPEQKKLYWDSLLNVSTGESEGLSGDDMYAIQQTINNSASNAEKISLANSIAGSPEQKQKVREDVISAVSINEEERLLKHRLQEYVSLLEPNPRAMKRLINDVSTARAINFLYNRQISTDSLILWTILKQQHPLLAYYLLQHPEIADKIFSVNGMQPATGNTEIDVLLKQDAVKHLFRHSLNEKDVLVNSAFLRLLTFKNEPQ